MVWSPLRRPAVEAGEVAERLMAHDLKTYFGKIGKELKYKVNTWF